jgi:ketosteroid isomerase-like protein
MREGPNRDAVEQWVAHYARAWEGRDPAAAVALFTEDATYRSQPFREPHIGLEGVERYWRDAVTTQNDVRVRFGNPVVDGERVAVEWWTTAMDEGAPSTIAGILLLRFTADGRCSALREHWAIAEGMHEPYSGWGADAGTAMPVDTVRDAAQRWGSTWQSAWERYDVEPVVNLYADDVVFRTHPFREPHLGPDGVRAYVTQAYSEEEDTRARFAEPLADDRAAAVEWWATGKEKGVPSTLAGCSMLTFHPDGVVVAQRDYWNMTEDHLEPHSDWGA